MIRQKKKKKWIKMKKSVERSGKSEWVKRGETAEGTEIEEEILFV